MVMGPAYPSISNPNWNWRSRTAFSVSNSKASLGDVVRNPLELNAASNAATRGPKSPKLNGPVVGSAAGTYTPAPESLSHDVRMCQMATASGSPKLPPAPS